MIPERAHLDHRDDVAEHQRRRQALRQHLGGRGIAVIAATPELVRNNDVAYPYRPDSDFRYLTGLSEPGAIAVLAPGHEAGDYILFCRERDPGAETWTGYRIGTEGAMRDYGADQAWAVDDFEATIGALLDGRDCLYMTRGIHPAFEQQLLDLVDAQRGQGRRCDPPNQIMALDVILHEMRLHKSAHELTLMRQAASTTAAGHRAAMQAARPGVREYQLAATLHYIYGLDGMDWSFPAVVGSGNNGCILHYVENADVIADGDLVLIDSGAEYRGYAGDITRTFPASGRFTPAQRAIYDIVLAANEAGINACRVGSPINAVHEAALAVLVDGLLTLGLLTGDRQTVIDNGDYRDFFMHGTSHWLGMDVHDVGDYHPQGRWRRLAPGMVLTVEPGLYIAPDQADVDARYRGIGIRIEDDVAITEAGPEVLTSEVPKAPEAIEALMDEAS